MNSFSTFLFAEPTFSEGAARMLDFGNTLSEYNSSPSPQDADFWALTADCQAVAAALRQAILERRLVEQQQTRQEI